MDSRGQQISVGLFVIVAAAILIFIVFSLSGAFAGSATVYHAKFNSAAGLEPGASVRYAGGPKIGHVTKLRIDPSDSSKIEMTISVQSGLPIKTDSKVKIMSFSPLGDNHVEVSSGSSTAPLAPSGATLPGVPYVGFNELTEQISELSPKAKELMTNLNARVEQLKVTIDRVDDVLNDRNRANISGSLAQLNGMLAEDGPLLTSTMKNVNTASAKIDPLIDQLRKTTQQASDALKHIDSVVVDNKDDIRASIIQLRTALVSVNALTDKLNQILDSNSDNIDQLLL